MSCSIVCRDCGRANAYAIADVGNRVACSGCGREFTAPAPTETTQAPARPFACPACGRKYALKPELAGKKVRCPNCGEGVRVPGGEAADLARPTEQAWKPVVGKEAAGSEKRHAQAKKRKPKKKGSQFFETRDVLSLVGGICAFVAVLAILAWAYPGLRFPLGGILVLIGFLVYVLGLVSLRQVAAAEGDLPALLFRFFPPYQWWFVATRWADTKEFVAFFVAGSLIMAVGGAVLKTSEAGKLAAANERAYQKAMHEHAR